MDLKFDKMTVNTTLAQDYLTEENLKLIVENLTNSYFNGNSYHKENTKSNWIPITSEQLENLAVNLLKHTNLITQMEYLYRKIPIEDTSAQISLIIQQVQYLLSEYILSSDADSYIPMLQDTPLLFLGFVPRTLVTTGEVKLVAESKNTVPICYLFAKICYESGIRGVKMCYEEANVSQIVQCRRLTSSVVGVISECADVDSAVDVFLGSSKQAPWKLKRILIQESVYRQTIDALTWKCKLKNERDGKPTDTSTSDVFEYEGRKFTIDPLGVSDSPTTDVAVEAYRTRKELMTLLNKFQPNYLSLWANDIAEINEISHGVSSLIVWVNSYADFRGPPRISEAVFSDAYRVKDIKLPKKYYDFQLSWVKLGGEARHKLLRDALNVFISKNSVCSFNYVIKKNIRNGYVSLLNSFVHVGKDYMCVGMASRSSLMYSSIFSVDSEYINEAFFNSLLLGNSFLFRNCNEEVYKLADALIASGIPVITDKMLCDKDSDIITATCRVYYGKFQNLDQLTKVIWTNSGTIFAN